jgi:hypothetical protein
MKSHTARTEETQGYVIARSEQDALDIVRKLDKDPEQMAESMHLVVYTDLDKAFDAARSVQGPNYVYAVTFYFTSRVTVERKFYTQHEVSHAQET